jgi:hypothetical protein
MSITDGFGNRFLYSCIDRSKLLPFGGNLNHAVLDRLGEETAAAVRTAQALGQMFIADEAKPLWAKIYIETEAAELTQGLIDHLTARAPTQMLRLALLYALLDGSPQITAPHIEAARALWRFCEASARYIFNNLSSDHIADTIMRELEDARPDGVNRNYLYRDVFRANTRALDINEALRKLEAAGKARHTKQKAATGFGRSREVWFAV